MSNQRHSAHIESARIAMCGMVVALSVVLMLTSSIIPVMTYAAPLLCGVLLIPVMLEYDRKTAWTVFAASALLTLILGFDKELAFFYLFFGYYPIIKWRIERLRSRPWKLALKLAVFSVSLILMYVLLGFVIGFGAVMADFEDMGKIMAVAFFLMMLLCLMLFDRLLTPLSIVYVTRFQPKLKKLLHRF